MHGKKLDAGKPDWSLLPLKSLESTVQALTFGAKKYKKDNWKHVPDAENRYFAAAIRHLSSYQAGEKLDKESNLPHLAHAACCLLFLIWFENNASKLSNSKKTANKNLRHFWNNSGIVPYDKKVHQPPLRPIKHRRIPRSPSLLLKIKRLFSKRTAR